MNGTEQLNAKGLIELASVEPYLGNALGLVGKKLLFINIETNKADPKV